MKIKEKKTLEDRAGDYVNTQTSDIVRRFFNLLYNAYIQGFKDCQKLKDEKVEETSGETIETDNVPEMPTL